MERDLWRPDLSIARAIGTPAQRREARLQHADITVMTRDTVTDLEGISRYRTVVLDELSGYRAKTTRRWRATRQVVKGARTYGLTGTPAPNGYHDLWAQVFLLDEGKRLGRTLGAFRERYFTVGRRMPVTNIVTEWVLKPGAQDAINALLEDLCLSMRAEEYLELPELVFNELSITMPPKVRKLYDQFKKDLVLDLGTLGTYTAASAGVLSNRLRQLCAGFLYDDDRSGRAEWFHTERIEAVKEIVEGTGSPVLIFYQFVAEADALLKEIPDARSITEPNVIRDWNAGRVKVLVAHPKSAGHGLNLQHGGHTIIWSSLPWSLEEWLQSNARLHRQGQKNSVIVHIPLVPGTVDRVVLTALKNKANVQDALMAYLTENERMLR